LSGLSWFRMYAEFATDPDVQTLAFEDQRHYVVVLCMKCSGNLDKEYPSADRRYLVIRRTLGLDTGAADECKRRLMEAGLIDGNWHPRGWDSRQFVSDNSTTRTREWRERHRNVTVTDQIQITDTETETEKKGTALRALAPPKPRPSKRCPADFAITAELLAWAAQKVPGVNIEAETENFRDHEFKDAHTDWPATWRKWMRRSATEIPRGTSRQFNQPRPSAVERVRAATEKWLREGDDPIGGGVVIDG
jgi:hypothetical protein